MYFLIYCFAFAQSQTRSSNNLETKKITSNLTRLHNMSDIKIRVYCNEEKGSEYIKDSVPACTFTVF